MLVLLTIISVFFLLVFMGSLSYQVGKVRGAHRVLVLCGDIRKADNSVLSKVLIEQFVEKEFPKVTLRNIPKIAKECYL